MAENVTFLEKLATQGNGSAFSLPGLLFPVEKTLQAMETVAIITPKTNFVSTAEGQTQEVGCPSPVGWVVYITQIGDTLKNIAERFGIAQEMLAKSNCLEVNSLAPDSVLYVPLTTPTATMTEIHKARTTRCGPPTGWIIYIVQRGDTLYNLSQVLGVSIAQLQQANCLGRSTLIVTGQRLYVPRLPVRTPTLTATRWIMPSMTPPPLPTAIPTLWTPYPTNPPLPTSTNPPVPTPTNPPLPTPTAVPTSTGAPTYTPPPVPAIPTIVTPTSTS
jgi:LysM repeat protein